jgi:hypothetical protein
MAVWHTFFLILSAPNSHYSQQLAVTPDPAISNFKKVHQKAITICSRLSYQTGWAEKPFAVYF